jgi:inhibitor of KinA sporulation pathway (predicted exonuclease)
MSGQILVVDVEATCWEYGAPPGETSDIVEVGITCLGIRDLVVSQRRSILVKPIRSRVSTFCTQLTTLQQKDLEYAGSLKDACDILREEFDSESRPWASYGDYDQGMFRKCCSEMSVPYPFSPSHLNIKSLFAFAAGLEHEVGMAEALEMVGIRLEGTHHRGADDSWNVAQILRAILTGARSRISNAANRTTER